MQDEIWKTTESLKGFYEVSNLGRIRRSRKANGAIVGKILKPWINPHGYACVNIWLGQGIGKHRRLHKLVCEAFHGFAPEAKEVNHKNYDRKDNRSENLEWVTHAENQHHAQPKIREGTRRFHREHPEKTRHGSEVSSAKLTEKDVIDIRAAIQGGERVTYIARRYGVQPSEISRIKFGKRWGHI